MDRTGRSCYDTFRQVLLRRDGSIPVCVPLLDEDGDSAVLTSSYSIHGYESFEDWEHMSPRQMVGSLITLMSISRETIREHGGIPLEEAPSPTEEDWGD